MEKTRAPIQLSDHFTYKRLLRFVLSPILMMVFSSVYSIVDGFFVSNFAAGDPFTGLNLIFPFIMVLVAFGFMLGAGGTAIVSKTLGEGDQTLANKYFTFITVVTFSLGVVLAGVGIAVLKPVATLLGATDGVLFYAVRYGTIVLAGLPFFMLQSMFQSFFITAERPKTGFLITVAAGCTNIVLDALFVGLLKWGVEGAAGATVVSQCVGGIVPVIYFARKNKSILRFVKTKWYGKVLWQACYNGSSELLGNVAMSLVSMMYNWQLIKIVGNRGVDAFGIVMYVQFVFVAIFIGYCIGTAPIVGYNFGAQNRAELQNVFKKSMILIAIVSATMLALGVGLAQVMASIFCQGNPELLDMATRAMRLYSISFAFCGFSMFTSSFFTALNNGLVSAISSFGRTLVFQVLCIFLLPLWLNLDGVWIATPVAEVLSFALSALLLIVCNKRYGYIATKRNSLPTNLPAEEQPPNSGACV